MPFDASGNFTRVYNFQQDAANGIKILAARVDGEFDNIATGMNAVFFRDGRVPMQADLRMNINGITGLKDGALGSPALKFNTDPNTGVYLPGLNQYGIQVNSVQRGVFTTAGFDVTGNLTASGSIFEAGTQLSAKYAQLGAANTFTGDLTVNANILQKRDFAQHKMMGSDNLKGWRITSAINGGSDGGLTIQHTTDGYVSNFTNAGVFNADGSANIGGNLTASGNVYANQAIIGSNTVPGTGVYLNSAAGNLRTFGFQSAGVYAGDITLQTNNTDIKYNSNGGSHQFTVTGGAVGTFNTSGLFVPLPVQTSGSGGGVVFVPRDASSGNSVWYSPTANDIRLNNAGAGDVLQITSNLIQTNKVLNLAGFDSTYNVAVKQSRAGQVGYHMYNGGASAEWLMYQPAAAVGHEWRLATYVGGTTTDRLKMTTSGDLYHNGSLSVRNEIWLGNNDTTGVLRFGNAQAASSKYLFFDGTQFQLSASLTVGGNISSSSDARLKSNVREFTDSMAFVRQLQPKRFTMYGKPDFGFIAQEVQPVLPEVINRDEKGFLSIDYGRLTAVLAGAIKNLDERLTRAGL